MSTASELESAMLEAFKRLGMGGKITGGSRGYGKFSDSSDGDGAKESKKLASAIASTAEGFDKLSKMVKDQRGKLMDAGNSIKEYEKVLDETTRLVKRHAGLTEKMNEAAEDWRGSTVAFASYLEKHSKVAKNFTSVLGQSTANAAMFGSAMLASHKQVEEGTEKYFRMMTSLSAAVAPLNKGILRAAGAWDDSTNALKEDLGPATFAKVRNALGAMEATIADSMAGLNAGSLKEMVERAGSSLERVFSGGPNSNKIKTAMLDLAVKMEAMGADLDINHGGNKLNLTDGAGNVNMEVFNLLKNDMSLLAEVTRKMSKVSDEASDSIQLLNKEALKAGTVLNSWTDSIANSMPTINNLKRGLDHLATSSVIAANFDKAKGALGQLYGQIMDFNVAMVPETYWGVQEASLRMGLSFEDTMKYMQDNKRVMALYGNGFTAYNSQLEGTFQKFGHTMAQAIDIVAPATEAAALGGINTRNATAMNSFMEESMNSWQRMSGIINISAAEYMRMNAQLLSNQEIQSTLMGMDSARAAVYARDTIATRDHYIAMGLSADNANDLLLTQRRAARESVIERMSNAAKTMVLAQMVGVSNQDSQRLNYLSNKRLPTAAEEQELIGLRGQFAQKREQYLVNASGRGQGSQQLAEVLMEQLGPSGPQAEAIDKSLEVQMRGRAGQAATEADLERTQALAKGNENLAVMGNAINSVTSIINSAFLGAIVSSGAALIGLAWQAARAAMALRGLGMGGGFGGGGRRGRRGGRGGGRGGAAAGGAVAGRTARGGAAAIPARAAGGGWGAAAKGASRRIPVVGSIIGAGMLASDWSSINDDVAAGGMTSQEGDRAKGGAVGGLAGGVAGAAAGAAIGSVVPVVGTIIGGIVGGLLGAYGGDALGSTVVGAVQGDRGSRNTLAEAAMMSNPMTAAAYFGGKQMGWWNADSLTGGSSIMGGPGASVPPSVTGMAAAGLAEPGVTAVSAGVNSAAAAEGVASVLNVQDVGAHTHLASIATKLSEAIELLQILADGGSPEARAALAASRRASNPSVPSTWAYMSGRQPR
jgi:hypothetical protein